MKADFLLSSLCFAPLALAAPLSRHTILIAGESIWKSARENAPAVLVQVGDAQHAIVSEQHTSTPTDEESSSKILDLARPMTTKELMELTWPPHPAATSTPKHTQPPKPKISVGTLVVPGRVGIFDKLFDPETSPYLIPGQYVVRQRADVLVVGMILACALIVIAMESWEIIAHFFTSTFRRQRAIQLPGSECTHYTEECTDGDSDDDDDSDAPFGGYKHRVLVGLRLPEKVDEKAT